MRPQDLSLIHPLAGPILLQVGVALLGLAPQPLLGPGSEFLEALKTLESLQMPSASFLNLKKERSAQSRLSLMGNNS